MWTVGHRLLSAFAVIWSWLLVMNRYTFMTSTLVVCNVISLVAMFIAAFWGFTYPSIVLDGYESGKSAIVATFMCVLSIVCLCGLNYQNYYLLIAYGCIHLLIMLNQMFSILPFSWTRIPNYPVVGDVSTQIYILLVPKIILVVFSFLLAYKLRADDIQRKQSRSDPRCRCESQRSNASNRPSLRGFHNMPIDPTIGGQLPPPLPPPNASNFIRTPPLYPMHRPSLSNPPPPPLQCRTPPLIHNPINGPLPPGPPSTPPWRSERKWSGVDRPVMDRCLDSRSIDRSRWPTTDDRHYYRDVYNPNY